MPVSISSANTFESKLFPSVSFTLRKMTEGRRAKLRQATAALNERLTALSVEEEKLLKTEPVDRAALEHTQNELRAVLLDIDSVWIPWAVRSVSGMKVELEWDDKVEEVDATPDNFLSWPPEFMREVLDASQRLSKMTEAEAKNFVSLSTSGTQTESETQVTSA